MTDKLLRVMLDWFMISDPWLLDEASHELILNALDTEGRARGYTGWVEAYHLFKVKK
ncbi:hypothetical protein LCGC14_2627430 [marine sediment metagenome]|uniref:Uncharacterized protein n=1 Tax=marine sediment metagenome TaxID=412755 RepID=A0A0F9CCD1_9ZZZZ